MTTHSQRSQGIAQTTGLSTQCYTPSGIPRSEQKTTISQAYRSAVALGNRVIFDYPQGFFRKESGPWHETLLAPCQTTLLPPKHQQKVAFRPVSLPPKHQQKVAFLGFTSSRKRAESCLSACSWALLLPENKQKVAFRHLSGLFEFHSRPLFCQFFQISHVSYPIPGVFFLQSLVKFPIIFC